MKLVTEEKISLPEASRRGVAARYAVMKELRLKCPIPLIRRIMNVSASGYYAWVDRPLPKRAQEEIRLELEIRAAHKRTRQTYGPERLQHDLAEHGIRVGICRIKRICWLCDGRAVDQESGQSLFRAVAAKRPAKGLIHHSGRGSQYCSCIARYWISLVCKPR